MSLNEMVLCKYKNCNKIYQNALFLPCGNRCCEEHVRCMKMKTENIDQNEIKCFFCSRIHLIPNEGFPNDELIEKLLNNDYSENHGEANKSFKNLKEAIDCLLNIDQDCLSDYFKNIQSEIELEREKIKYEIDKYYDKLIEELNNYKKVSFDELNEKNIFFKKNELIDEFKKHIELKNYKFDLQTLNGNEEKWSQIKIECNELNKSVKKALKLIEYEIKNKKTVIFESNQNEFDFKNFYGKLIFKSNKINYDSTILNENNWIDLIKLCSFGNADFKLIYRATLDGFTNEAFHSNCENFSKTLTVIKSENNNIFGGYTDATWIKNSGFKSDENAFIFSLVNQENQPSIIKCKKPQYAIYCHNFYGITFGQVDFMIKNQSNLNYNSVSNLGACYDSNKGPNYLAGSKNFKTKEIEVFQVIKDDN